MLSSDFSKKYGLYVGVVLLLPIGYFLWQQTGAQDQARFLSLNLAAQQLPDWVWTNLSLLGNGWSVFALAFPCLLFARKALYAAIISGLFSGIFSPLTKNFFHTDRPAGVIDPALFNVIGQPILHNAMPSGHTMTAFGIATAMYFSLTPARRRPWSCVFVLAAAAGFSRIAVGAHWPEDVLVGGACGIVAGLLGAYWSGRIPARYLTLRAWPAKIVLVASGFAVYLLLMQTLDFELNALTQKLLAVLVLLTWVKLIPPMFFSSR